jgi:hypothetical protein
VPPPPEDLEKHVLNQDWKVRMHGTPSQRQPVKEENHPKYATLIKMYLSLDQNHRPIIISRAEIPYQTPRCYHALAPEEEGAYSRTSLFKTSTPRLVIS